MTRPWDASQIAELRALCEAATKGPWERDPTPWGDDTSVGGPADEVICECNVDGLAEEEEAYQCEHNAAFIATARTALPEALDALDAAERRATAYEARAGKLELDLSKALAEAAVEVGRLRSWKREAVAQAKARDADIAAMRAVVEAARQFYCGSTSCGSAICIAFDAYDAAKGDGS